MRSTSRNNVAAARQAIRNCIAWTMHNTLEDIRRSLATLKLSLNQRVLRTPSESLVSLSNALSAGIYGPQSGHSTHSLGPSHLIINHDICTHSSVNEAVDGSAPSIEEQSVLSSHASFLRMLLERLSL